MAGLLLGCGVGRGSRQEAALNVWCKAKEAQLFAHVVWHSLVLAGVLTVG